MDDKKIHWKEIVIIPFIASTIFLLALIFGVPEHSVVASLPYDIIIGFAYTLLPFIAALLVTFFVKNRRILHFFIALVVAWTILGAMFSLRNTYNQAQNEEIRQLIKEEINSIAISKTSITKEGAKYFAEVLVSVLSDSDILKPGKSIIEIRTDNSPNSRVWGMGTISISPYGYGYWGNKPMTMYRARFEVIPDEIWKKAVVVVKGENGKIEFGEIRP